MRFRQRSQGAGVSRQVCGLPAQALRQDRNGALLRSRPRYREGYQGARTQDFPRPQAARYSQYGAQDHAGAFGARRGYDQCPRCRNHRDDEGGPRGAYPRGRHPSAADCRHPVDFDQRGADAQRPSDRRADQRGHRPLCRLRQRSRARRSGLLSPGGLAHQGALRKGVPDSDSRNPVCGCRGR